MLVRKRTIVAASLSLVIFSATISVLIGIGAAPNLLIGNPDAFVITSKGSASILNSMLEAKLADQLLENDLIGNVSPEIFAFAQVEGNAVIIRGVEFDSFMAVEEAELVPGGSFPDNPSQGLMGSRLAERLDAKIGDRYPLVGSYDPSIVEVEIVGIIESTTSAEDELIVSLQLARCLSGTPNGYVSIIRVLGDTAELNKIFGEGLARFSIFDLTIAKETVAKNSSTTIGLSLKNWGDENGTAHVTIVDETRNTTILDNYTMISPGAVEKLSAKCHFDVIGNHSIVAHLDGSLPQTIKANITVINPYITAIVQRQVVEYNNFTVRVVDGNRTAAPNATVTIEGQNYITNTSGHCVIGAHLLPGNYTLNANLSGYDNASVSFTVVNSSDVPQTAKIEVYRLVLSPSTVKTQESCVVTVYVQNLGNLTGSSTINIKVNGIISNSQSVSLRPLESTVLYCQISFSTAGNRVISSGSYSATLGVESKLQVNPEMVQLLLRYGGSGSLNPSRGELLYHTTKISESNIIIVLVSLAILSAILVTLGISTSFMKEINDNQKVIGILRSLGASSKQLLEIIFKEAILVSLPAVAIGIAGGYALALLIQSTDSLIAFGHVINPVLDPTFLIAATIGSISICIGSGLIAGLSVTRRRTIKMIRGLNEETDKQVTLKELLGDG